MATPMLERYRVLAQLGRGGMAEVYLASAEGPNGFAKLLVIKVLEASLARDPTFVAMFSDEARLSARLNHPNVVQTYEVGESNGRHFMAMEYLEGQPLNKIVERFSPQGGLGPAVALRIIVEALSGLHYAHELRDFDGRMLNVVHRDITPQNLFVTYEGQVKVVDFGIAKAFDSRAETTIGTVKGKVTYMAPEQARGEVLDRRADVFSIAVVLWELLAGRRLWEGLTDVAVIGRLVQGDIPGLGTVRPDLSPGLVRTVSRALHPKREERPASASVFQRELEVHLEELSTRISPRRLGEILSDAFLEERTHARSVIKRQLDRLARTTPSGETPAHGLMIPRAFAGAMPILGEGSAVHDAVTALHTGTTGNTTRASTGSIRLGPDSERTQRTEQTGATPAYEAKAKRPDTGWFVAGGLLVVLLSLGGAFFVSMARSPDVKSAVGGRLETSRAKDAEDDTVPIAADCFADRKPVVELTGEITEDAELACDKDYLLRFTATVLPGTTLKIRPGTRILGDVETKGKLVVQPGGRIEAVGRADAPIVFTSSAPMGQRKAGDWGGLIVLGQAPLNLKDSSGKSVPGAIEGLTTGGEYGGQNPNDSSGTIRYVRIEYPGTEVAPNNEINGLTLGGVGRGTVVEYVQVKDPADDCFEFFGGTVDAKHLICTRVDDDAFDWDYGYTGRLQFIVATSSSASTDGSNGFEGDNDPNGSENEPVSAPTIYNASLFGKNRVLEGKEHYGMLLRRGTHGRLRNILITGFSAAVDLRDKTTKLNIAGSQFHGNLLYNIAFPESSTAKKSEKMLFDDDGNFDEGGYLLTPGLRISETDPGLVGTVAGVPKPERPLLGAGAEPPDDGFFDVQASFVGAFRDRADRWDTGAWVSYE